MKQSIFIIILVIIAGLTAACGAGIEQPALAQGADEGVNPLVLDTQSNSENAIEADVTPLTFDTQSNNENAVEVEVTPLNLSQGGTSLDFEVAFSTHSVDLAFDPAAISFLRDDAGREYPALTWEGPGPGGHHRSGVLRFKVPDYTTDFVEVIIHDVAGVPERVFLWKLTS
jgi:hypothetical protein